MKLKIDEVNPKKASQATNIPNKVVKENRKLISFYVYYLYFRSIVTFLDIKKVYKGLLFNQLYPYFENNLSKLQCGFRKGYKGLLMNVAIQELF